MLPQQQNLNAYYNKPIKVAAPPLSAAIETVDGLQMNQKSQFQSFVERFKTQQEHLIM